MDKIETIKKQLIKKATGFITGGFRPTNSETESWIGRVYLYKEDEEIPKDKYGDLMLPLFQLFVNNLSFIPKALNNTKILTVFCSNNLPMDLTLNGENWLIREYTETDKLIIKDLSNKNTFLKPFPLQPQIIEEDYPIWDSDDIPLEIANEILELEDSGEIDSYYDIIENHYGHKIGGYPTFCQSGIDFGDDFEFVLQIDSDEKANLNIIDSGKIFLAKNTKTGEWKYYCDFF